VQAVPLTQLEGMTTCLFFSARWCRPCRTFTPRLLHLYNSSLHHDDHQQQQQRLPLEIILVSLDRDEKSFSEHINNMPWLAAPFDASVTTRLCHRYHIHRIPSLIPLSCDGKSVEEDATHLVEEYGVEAFPFGAKRRRELQAMDEAKRHGKCKLHDLIAGHRGYVISRDGLQVISSGLKCLSF